MDKTPVLKLILIGDSGVGKTSMIKRFVQGQFNEDGEAPNIGTDMQVLYMAINGCRVIIRILDTAGQEKHNSITNSFYRLSHGVIVVYDVTHFESYQAVTGWLQRVRDYCGEAAVLIVGNKSDLLVGKTVNVRTVQRLAELEDYEFIETSALADSNVKEAFHRILQLILIKTGLVEDDETVSIRMLPKPRESELEELDFIEEQEERKRLYKRALEKLVQKQLSQTEDPTVKLSASVQTETRTSPWKCCGR